ncbi:MAG: tetratricopeptide repeat protein, partial [Oscillospiraceae bacterium]|nr:tetratricopeptide repeat protein [Oscillospiraceae bacterium]
MDWTVLGIAPTKDKKAITAAYRARLVQVNPEDKPEEFKQLRAAYEQALEYAAKEEQPAERDESPVGLWMERVRGVYFNYPARICKNSWAELLMDDVCIALDKRADAETALLRFLMEEYFLPQEIWQLLDDTFHFAARRDALYEQFPREFIDNAVLSGIANNPGLSYYLFTPGENAAACDDYRRLYHRANSVEVTEMGPILDQMEALPEQHPYGKVLRYRLMLEQGEEAAATEGYRALAEAYPDDFVLVMGWASLCVKNEQWQLGEELCRRVVALKPDHRSARRNLAECLAQQGNYKDAKKEIYDLMDMAGGDMMALHYLSETLKAWNVQMEQQLRERIAADPADNDAIIELAWCQLQNEQKQEALATAALASEDYEDKYAYHNLQAKVRYANAMYEDALQRLQTVEQLVREMDPQSTDEKVQKRIEGLPDIIQLQAACLAEMKDREAALAQH